MLACATSRPLSARSTSGTHHRTHRPPRPGRRVRRQQPPSPRPGWTAWLPAEPRSLPPGTPRDVVDSRTAPAVGTVTADTPLSPSPRSAVPAGTTLRAGWRDDGRDALSVRSPRCAGHRGSRGPEHQSRTRSAARPRARPSFDASFDQPPHDRLRQPWPLALAALEQHRFRAAASGGPWPPSHGSRTVRPQSPSRLCVPTRCRVPVPAVPDRLETSSAAAALRARGSPAAADRGVSLSPRAATAGWQIPEPPVVEPHVEARARARSAARAPASKSCPRSRARCYGRRVPGG